MEFTNGIASTLTFVCSLSKYKSHTYYVPGLGTGSIKSWMKPWSVDTLHPLQDLLKQYALKKFLK